MKTNLGDDDDQIVYTVNKWCYIIIMIDCITWFTVLVIYYS